MSKNFHAGKLFSSQFEGMNKRNYVFSKFFISLPPSNRELGNLLAWKFRFSDPLPISIHYFFEIVKFLLFINTIFFELATMLTKN